MSSDWQRLPFFAVIFFSFRALRKLVNLYPALIGVAFTANQLDLTRREVLFYLACAFALLVLSALLRWLNFFYKQEHDKILIRSGIFSKERLELCFERIQSVSLKEPFYFRPFNRVILTMDSAGSAQDEVNIAALDRESAEQIKSIIQRVSESDQSALDDGLSSEISVSRQDLLVERTMQDIIIHGISRNRAWIFIALGWPFFERLEPHFHAFSETLGLDLSTWVDTQSTAALIVLLFAVIVIIIALTTLFSVLGSIFALANYRLTYSDGSYQRNSGLLNKHEIKVKRSRLQSLVYEKTWLDRVFRRVVMTFEPFAARASQNAMDAMMQKILVPSLREDEFDTLINHVWPELPFARDAFHPISRFYIARKTLNYGLIIGLALCIFALSTEQLGLLGFLLLLPLLVPVFYLRWRRYGWQRAGDFIVVRSGFIGLTYVFFPRYKIQQAQFHQSLFLERRGLASIVFVLASRSVALPFVDAADARELLDEALADAEFSGRSWM